MEKEKVLFSIPTLRMNIKHMEIKPKSQFRGPHIHNEIEIIRVDCGKILCTVNDQNVYLEEGQCMLVNSYHIMTYI